MTNHIIKPLPSHHAKEAGNILIYILGAIFLLGLLVIMTKGSSTPGSNADRENLMIYASDIQQYGQELERAVAYVMQNGHSEADIRFAHPDAASGYGNITDTPSRQVFATQGGAAKFRRMNNVQVTPSDFIFTGENVVTGVGSTDSCTTASCADLVALLMNVSKDFCLLINDKNHIENIGDTPPQDTASVAYGTEFVGNFTNTQYIKDDGTLYLSGHKEGCFEGNGDPASGTYHYYRVLLSR